MLATITEQGHDVDTVADRAMDTVEDVLCNMDLKLGIDDYEAVKDGFLEALQKAQVFRVF